MIEENHLDPICLANVINKTLDSDFVGISAAISFVEQCSEETLFLDKSALTIRYLMTISLVWFPLAPFLAILRAVLLSPISRFFDKSKSPSTNVSIHPIHKVSNHAEELATYSASAVEGATIVCLIDFHETALPAILKTDPDVDVLSSLQAGQSESL